jgi:hypothetical protein
MSDTTTQPSALTTVELDQPIRRGESELKSIQIRKPKAGELRGVSLSDLFDMKADAVLTMIPRVSSPTLTATEVNQLEASDFAKFAVRLVASLLPQESQQEVASLGLN